MSRGMRNDILDDYSIHLQLFITQLDVELFTVKLDVVRSMVLEVKDIKMHDGKKKMTMNCN